jgi:UDP-glucose 4-epimerase
VSEQIPPARRRRASARAATPAHVNGAGEPRLAEIAAERMPERIAEQVTARTAELVPAEPAADVELAQEQRSPDAQSDQGAVVITGICGRMGLLLARKLHRHQRVVGIDRRRFEGRPEDIVHHQLDLRRRQTRDIFRAGGIRAVVHLGIMHDLRESDRTHHEWNVVGFQKLLEYLSQYQVPKLVLLSTATLYGPSPDNPQFLSEEAPLLGAQEFSRIRDLVEVDMLAQSFFWKHPKAETVILRPCHILGRVRNAPSNYCRTDRPMTVLGFDPMMQVIHERDVVAAMELALRPGVRGIFNLRGPGELPLSRMIRMLGKRPRAVPGPLIKGLMGGLWSSRAASFPSPELDHLRYICMVDDTRARRELGFTPRYTLEQTLHAVNATR